MSAMKVKKTKVAKMNRLESSIRKCPIETPELFDENKTYTFAVPITWTGREMPITQVIGKELNYAVKTVYAESGGLKDGTAEERKAMADLLTNRIGCLGTTCRDKKTGKAKRPETYMEVIQAPGAFECYNNGNSTQKFTRGSNPKENIKGDEIKTWNLAYEAVASEIKEVGGLGPKYKYTSNRSGKKKGLKNWVYIGASRFRIDKTEWEKVGSRWILVKQGIERERTPHMDD